MNSDLLKYLEYKQRSYLHSFTADLKLPKNISVEDKVQSFTSEARHLSLTIDIYKGNSPVVKKIQHLFNSNQHPAVHAVLVHGSIGTGEEVNYSDFDGIIVLDSRSLTSVDHIRSLGELIRKSAMLMYEQDALQHHGWAFIDKEDFKDYPDADIPAVLVEHSKVIYPDYQLESPVTVFTQNQDYTVAFNRLCDSINSKIKSGRFLGSFYSFKNFCSEVLMLPALYCQARYRTGVFKRESFIMAAKDFNESEWMPVDTISNLRKHWDQHHVSASRERYIGQLRFIPGIHLLRTSIPSALKQSTDAAFTGALQHLMNKMKNKINQD